MLGVEQIVGTNDDESAPQRKPVCELRIDDREVLLPWKVLPLSEMNVPS
jgi:hypothetical protein